jgi:hypothetical protein
VTRNPAASNTPGEGNEKQNVVEKNSRITDLAARQFAAPAAGCVGAKARRPLNAHRSAPQTLTRHNWLRRRQVVGEAVNVLWETIIVSLRESQSIKQEQKQKQKQKQKQNHKSYHQ